MFKNEKTSKHQNMGDYKKVITNSRARDMSAERHAKTKALKKKMVEVSHKDHIGYTIEDHKGNVLKKG